MTLGHLQGCADCLMWFGNPANRGRSNTTIDAAAMMAADMADPEYRKVRFGTE